MWGRPFDEQSISRIREETDAFFKILEGIYQGKYEVIGATILDDEIEQIEEAEKREAVKVIVDLFVAVKIEKFSKILQEQIKLLGLQDKDAMHLAFAVGNSDYFITCDDKILEKWKELEERCRIKVVSPVEFVREVL